MTHGSSVSSNSPFTPEPSDLSCVLSMAASCGGASVRVICRLTASGRPGKVAPTN
jgi:hypothetical protein